jgi:hypothetical protein
MNSFAALDVLQQQFQYFRQRAVAKRVVGLPMHCRSIAAAALLFALCVRVEATPAPATPARDKVPTCNCAAPAPAAAVPDTRGTAQQPLVVSATLPPKTVAEIAWEDRDRRDRGLRDDRTFLLGIVTVLVLVVQFLAFAVQAKLLRESVDEAKRATQATLTAARATQATVETMDMTARRQLRAYVFVLGHSLEQMEPGGRVKIHVTLKNFGQTPAYGLAISGMSVVAPVFEDRSDPNARDGLPAGSLGPGAIYTITSTLQEVLTAAHVDQLKIGALTLFVSGIVRYETAFKEERILMFRLRTGFGVGGKWNELVSASDGNYTDEPD